MAFWNRSRRHRGSSRKRPALLLETFENNVRKVCNDSIYEHVFGNPDREVGGVLIGNKGQEGRLPWVQNAIPAISADEQRATLTFTQESWEHVHAVMDEEFPNSDIVGWYHSHPGFGIFLSEHDKFIHNNFFGDLSQVALVVDPLAGTEGVFTWQDGKIEEYFVQKTGRSPVSEASVPEAVPVRYEVTALPERKSYPALPVLIIAAIAIIAVLLLWGQFTGSDEPVSSVPPAGNVTGQTGVTGLTGASGPSGESGASGSSGPSGESGTSGGGGPADSTGIEDPAATQTGTVSIAPIRPADRRESHSERLY